MAEKLPIGCAARHQEILDRSNKLFESFVNGNRGYVAQELVDMEPKAALAVLAVMMDSANHDVSYDLTKYFVETA